MVATPTLTRDEEVSTGTNTAALARLTARIDDHEHPSVNVVDDRLEPLLQHRTNSRVIPSEAVRKRVLHLH